ncbi:MAG TPA: heme ABC exporter ATP-binding protein CcmA [Myxococcota bacterium]|nr:heme ABC exporter ATP-binding protein CcmA [Myxococcota bacterium]
MSAGRAGAGAWAIEARGLEKRFGPVSALRNLDLSVPAGTSLAVVGPNGAGKTTLLRLLAGLARPSAGRLEVGPPDPDRRRRRAGIGYLGHATLLYAALTARENLVFAARLQGVSDPDARAGALLASHGLEGFADRCVGEFSRGMAQRVAIARALVHDPPLVLLDEPFTGLDPDAAEGLAARLVGLHDGGRTVILVTHDLARAATFAERVVLLRRGALAADVERGDAAAGELEVMVRAALGRPR